MRAALRAELIKFRSVRSSVVLLGFIVVASLLVAVLVGSLANFSAFDEPLAQISALLTGVQISRLLVGVLAVLMITQEYRFATIRATLAANPRRPQVYLAKVLAAVVLTVTASLALMAGALGIGGGILQMRGQSIPWGNGTLWRVVAGQVLMMIAFALACLGIGAIVRSSAGGIVIAMVWPIVVEPILFGIFTLLKHQNWSRWLPYGAGDEITSIRSGRTFQDVTALSPWAGFAYFCVWAIGLLVLGGWLLQKRDA
jgi:ABC-type transport system involved in multi-copper enzyme maturation permease subunit